MILLFLSTFAVTLLLGFQSRCVNSGQVLISAMNSLLIGTANLVLLTHIPQDDLHSQIAYLAGGPFGIVSSMYLHKYLFPKAIDNDNN